jgi:hypothetical protein
MKFVYRAISTAVLGTPADNLCIVIVYKRLPYRYLVISCVQAFRECPGSLTFYLSVNRTASILSGPEPRIFMHESIKMSVFAQCCGSGFAWIRIILECRIGSASAGKDGSAPGPHQSQNSGAVEAQNNAIEVR